MKYKQKVHIYYNNSVDNFEENVRMSHKKEESSGWFMAISIGIIVAILLIIVIFPNLQGKKNQKEEEGSLDTTISSEISVSAETNFDKMFIVKL